MNPPVNWKRNLLAVWLAQYLALAGFGMCGPFIPLFIKDAPGIINDVEREAWGAVFTFAGLTSLLSRLNSKAHFSAGRPVSM